MATISISKNRGRRGRPPKADQTKPWTIRIPQSIAEPWELLLYDPLIGRSKLSLRQFIISELMKLLLEAWKEGKGEIQISHILTRLSSELSSLEEKS